MVLDEGRKPNYDDISITTRAWPIPSSILTRGPRAWAPPQRRAVPDLRCFGVLPPISPGGRRRRTTL
ncbi:MAG: hypothetical protein ACLTYW_04330 [Collinsella sp.]